MHRATTLQDMDLQFPVQPEAGYHAQGRGRRLVLGRGGSEQEDRPLAGLRAHLQPANLLGAGLGQPGDQCAAGIALDQLFGAPQAS